MRRPVQDVVVPEVDGDQHRAVEAAEVGVPVPADEEDAVPDLEVLEVTVGDVAEDLGPGRGAVLLEPVVGDAGPAHGEVDGVARGGHVEQRLVRHGPPRRECARAGGHGGGVAGVGPAVDAGEGTGEVEPAAVGADDHPPHGATLQDRIPARGDGAGDRVDPGDQALPDGTDVDELAAHEEGVAVAQEGAHPPTRRGPEGRVQGAVAGAQRGQPGPGDPGDPVVVAPDVDPGAVGGGLEGQDRPVGRRGPGQRLAGRDRDGRQVRPGQGLGAVGRHDLGELAPQVDRVADPDHVPDHAVRAPGASRCGGRQGGGRRRPETGHRQRGNHEQC